MASAAPLYLDTSAVLRAVLESGTSPEIEQQIAAAPALITSRLSLVESARALLRLRSLGTVSEAQIADASRDVRLLWSHCDIWELDRSVCKLASEVAPNVRLGTLDAMHLATFVMARERLAELKLLTADERLRDAAAGADL